jgi:transcriptional regulator with XRE-family HTH domain
VHPTNERLNQPGGLAERLFGMRRAAGLTGARMAADLQWAPSKVSKIENGNQTPSADDIRAWTAECGHPEAAGELLNLLADVLTITRRWKQRTRSLDGVQADILQLEAATTRLAEFQPGMISGLLQTADYARETLHLPCGPLSFGADEDEVERLVNTRMQRQRVLYEHGRQVQVIMLEGALRCRVVSVPTLAGQLDRLAGITGLATLELGIIPFNAAVPIFPLGGFRLHDDLVFVESIVGEQQLAEADDVVRYEKYMELLREAAVTGDEARRLITAAASDLRDERR